MPTFNLDQKEVIFKVVYYGPALAGKATNLEVIYLKSLVQERDNIFCISTGKCKILYLDYYPISLGKINDMKIKLRIFSVPSAIYNDPTPIATLEKVDGIIFVADSQKDKLVENLEGLKELKNGLTSHGMSINKIPVVMQWNKRDMPNICSIKELESMVNIYNFPSFPAIAPTAEGVFQCLKKLKLLMLL